MFVIKGTLMETKDEMFVIIENFQKSRETTKKMITARTTIQNESFLSKMWKFTKAAVKKEKNEE